MSLKDSIEAIFRPIGKKLNFRLYGLRFAPYYWVIPEREELTDELFTRRTPMAGIDLRVDAQLELLEDFKQRFSAEYNQIVNNFGPVDGELLHSFVRHYKPNRVIE